MFEGYLRRGQNRPAITGRTLRRHEQRAQARTEQRPGRHVIGHMDRAIVAASRHNGWLYAGDYLAALGVDARYASAFGKAVLNAFIENHNFKPDRGGKSIVNGRVRPTHRYTNDLDLIAGALAYARTRDLILTVPGHPVARAYASV